MPKCQWANHHPPNSEIPNPPEPVASVNHPLHHPICDPDWLPNGACWACLSCALLTFYRISHGGPISHPSHPDTDEPLAGRNKPQNEEEDTYQGYSCIATANIQQATRFGSRECTNIIPICYTYGLGWHPLRTTYSIYI